MQTIQLPELKDGEQYAGFTMKDGKPFEHIILLPGEAEEEMDWEGAKAWATEQGGELPDRQIGALLYANLKTEFEPEWYWLSEQSSPFHAWYQYFLAGSHCDGHKFVELRARAVRRLPI